MMVNIYVEVPCIATHLRWNSLPADGYPHRSIELCFVLKGAVWNLAFGVHDSVTCFVGENSVDFGGELNMFCGR